MYTVYQDQGPAPSAPVKRKKVNSLNNIKATVQHLTAQHAVQFFVRASPQQKAVQVCSVLNSYNNSIHAGGDV